MASRIARLACISILPLIALTSLASCSKDDSATDDSSSESTDTTVAVGTDTKQPGASDGGGTTGGDTTVDADGSDPADDQNDPPPLPPIGTVASLAFPGTDGVHSGECIALKLTAKDANGDTVRADQDVAFNVTDTTAGNLDGTVTASGSCHGATFSGGTLAAGESEFTIYYANSAPAAITLHLTGASIATADWQPTLTPNTPSAFDFVTSLAVMGSYNFGIFASNQCAGPFSFNVHSGSSYSSYEMLTLTDTQFPLEYVSGNVKLYGTSSCTPGADLATWTMKGIAVTTGEFWIKGTTNSVVKFNVTQPAFSSTLNIDFY